MASTSAKRRLFNKGARTIFFDDGSLKPQSHGSFDEKTAAKLLELFKSELIDMDNVTPDQLTEGAIQSRLESDAGDHEAEIAKRLAEARDARSKKSYDEAMKEGFSDEDARAIAGLPPLPKKPEEKKSEPAEGEKGKESEKK